MKQTVRLKYGHTRVLLKMMMMMMMKASLSRTTNGKPGSCYIMSDITVKREMLVHTHTQQALVRHTRDGAATEVSVY